MITVNYKSEPTQNDVTWLLTVCLAPELNHAGSRTSHSLKLTFHCWLCTFVCTLCKILWSILYLLACCFGKKMREWLELDNQIITLYNCDDQKSISESMTVQPLRQMGYNSRRSHWDPATETWTQTWTGECFKVNEIRPLYGATSSLSSTRCHRIEGVFPFKCCFFFFFFFFPYIISNLSSLSCSLLWN